MKKVVIIGGGALGLSSAYFLQKEGVEVHVISADSRNSHVGCSFGNAGMIVPSHFTPLAAPGVVKEGLKWMFDPKSPLYIKARMSPSFISWIWKFILAANAENVSRSGSVLLTLNQASRDLYHAIEKEENMHFHYQQGGLMMLYKSARYQDEEEHMAEKARTMGLDVEVLNRSEMLLHEDQLKADVLGAVWYKSDAHLLPEQFMEQMITHLEHKKVQFSFDTKVESFIKEAGKIKAVKTNNGEIVGDEWVVCSGSWSQQLVKDLKIRLPIEAGKGYHLHIAQIPLQLKTPSILCEARIALTPMLQDLRVSGTMEFSGLNLNINRGRVETIKERVVDYFERFDKGWFSDLEAWAGLRPVSPDGLPYIGRSDAYSNLSFNTGHAMMGLSLAPVSGKIMSDLLLKGACDYPISIFSPNRFT